jgi:hypothetical protein
MSTIHDTTVLWKGALNNGLNSDKVSYHHIKMVRYVMNIRISPESECVKLLTYSIITPQKIYYHEYHSIIE